MGTEYTKTLAKYAVDLKYEDLPEEVVEQVKKITLHTVGVSLASVVTGDVKNAMRMVREKGGTPQATVWGSDGLKVPVDEAVFVTGTEADTLDWEDCTWTGHASAGTIPTAFAIGEVEDSTGKEYIEAVVATYEVYQRIAMGIQPARESFPLLGTGPHMDWGLVLWQIFSSGIAAGKLMGMDEEQMAANISACCYNTPLCTGKINCGDIYHYAFGHSARAAVYTAQLVMSQPRIEYCLDALDEPDAFWRQVSDHVEWDWFDRNLGSEYLIMETLLKHWPANIWVQGPIECLHNLHEKYGFSADDVAKVELTPSMDIYSRVRPRPYQFMFAQYTASHCLAAYLNDPQPSADWFSEENRAADSRVAELEKLVELKEPKAGAMDGFLTFMDGTFPEFTVTVTLKNGEVLTESLRHPKGHPRNPFSMQEERDFFMYTAAPIVGEEKAKAFVEAIDDLENVGSIRDLIPLLCVD